MTRYDYETSTLLIHLNFLLLPQFFFRNKNRNLGLRIGPEWTASALDVVHPEGKGNGKVLLCNICVALQHGI